MGTRSVAAANRKAATTTTGGVDVNAQLAAKVVSAAITGAIGKALSGEEAMAALKATGQVEYESPKGRTTIKIVKP